ncbi:MULTISPECIES: acyl-CoA dehydrogenase family protein [Methylobacterium]|jgi:acyl-CoA dehydrogenase|uniref:acyl-CoA dehydrogenase family protein n=1 Tax=Methylobacterium TaxID=407 RepID=UPI0008E4EDCB|nr:MULTISPECIES: acyl-CoA dehydrogenase family protein [Methylobacterium]MBZ6414187.1 acyl-CoA dehydrogenase family protein [Methylobacterium sp.]MBK3397206.1 acyl-CoA dehydrogenase family protein [Methylobacterium ajmalii]MBK3411748.1 acyl-CoA dehydrogenase family protein [Methylobacterium ajmalii]MBK3422402.1 acyl-CoA dehydrogenase family protein [Methylobacterium ajmalii]SFF53735.1 acyl-CoA dehydrogenase [Methylobacterium sp. yr596]
MPDRTFLDWPFFEPRHRDLAAQADDWAARTVPALVDHHDVDGSCRRLVAALGEAGFLRFAAPEDGVFDVRALCLLRETFARHDGLADFAFAMQGLGTGALTLSGTPAQREAVLPGVRAGRRIAAFALTEPEAGSDVAQIALAVQPAGDGMVRLDGEKTWISNGGIADTYVVFARSGEAPGARGLSAYLVPADTPGLRIAERLDTIAPHPLARLHFENCRVPAQNRIGEAGAGFKVAMATLDVFRSTVGAAALGFARRALDASLARAQNRTLFGAPLAAMQLTQTSLAEMATAIDTAALHVYRAAWTRDSGAPRITREAAMAKMVATEAAQEVIDRAVQLHGGEGVRSGSVPETLYREIRALRIYEGATEVQKLVIARQILA